MARASDEWLDENSPPQDAFQSQLCVAARARGERGRALGIRAVNLRIGLVLGADGGIFTRLALAAKLGGAAVSATAGNGCRGSTSTTWCASSNSRSTTRRWAGP